MEHSNRTFLRQAQIGKSDTIRKVLYRDEEATRFCSHAMRELRRRRQFSEGNREALARRHCPTDLRMELAWGRKARTSANG